jgi:hypothetical protein
VQKGWIDPVLEVVVVVDTMVAEPKVAEEVGWQLIS